MWEPTAEIQAAAAAPSRAIGCGGGRRGKRSAALGPESTGEERQSRSGPGAAAAASGDGSAADERRARERAETRGEKKGRSPAALL